MNLYSRSKFLASAVLVLVCAAALTGATAQRRKAHKLRATAVLEITTDSAGIVSTRVIPVAILDEGRFHDASIYKATPRPMALDNGIVYEGQTSGIPAGYATILSSTNTNGWTALGKWQSVDAVKKPQATPPVTTRPTSARLSIAAMPPPRPRLQHSRNDLPRSAGRQPSGRPARRKIRTARCSNGAFLRSRRRHKRRRQSQLRLKALSRPRRCLYSPLEPEHWWPYLITSRRTHARSNSNGRPARSRKWRPRCASLPWRSFPGRTRSSPRIRFKNVVMRSFDLDLSNDAIIVLSAEIPGSYLAPGAKGAPGKFISRYVTVIARVDFEGVPQKLAASVTDSSRLDVAPRLELIDAVDVDGDGPAELLFREYSFDQKSFIIYGVGRNTVTKVFEGASTPLK